jgi:hypothetical protein
MASGAPGEAKEGPSSKKFLVIPGLTRNPESFSPARSAAVFPSSLAGKYGLQNIMTNELDSGSSPE